MIYEVTAPDGRTLEVTAPDGATQEQIMAYAQANMPQAPPAPDPRGGYAEILPGADVLTTLGNAPGSAFEFGKNYLSAITSPIDTAKMLGGMAAGGIEHASKASGLHELLSGVSGEGPPSANQRLASAYAQHMERRYNSVDAVRNTIETDPVGFAADVSFFGSLIGIAGKATRLGSAGQTLAKTMDPVNMAINASNIAINKVMPKGFPASLLETTLKLRTTLPDHVRARVVNTALDQGIPASVKGLAQAQKTVDGLEASIQAMTREATRRGDRIPALALFQNVKKLREDLGGIHIDAPTELKAANKLITQFTKNIVDETRKTHGGKTNIRTATLSPMQVLKVKRKAYANIKWATNKTKKQAQNETRKAIANAGMKELEKLDPRIKPTNRKLGDTLETAGELQRSVKRLRNNNLFGIDAKMATGLGMGADAAHGTGGILTGLAVAGSMLGNPRVKARAAITLHAMQKLADSMEAMTHGNIPLIVSRQLMEKAERLQQEMSAQMPQE